MILGAESRSQIADHASMVLDLAELHGSLPAMYKHTAFELAMEVAKYAYNIGALDALREVKSIGASEYDVRREGHPRLRESPHPDDRRTT